MNIKQLENEIRHYLSTEFTSQALFVNGKWGTGKTYFFKKTLEEKLSDTIENYLLISLYGLKDIEEIDKFLFVNLYPPAKFVEGMGKKAGKEASLLFKKGLGALLSKVNVNFDDVEYKDFINPENVLLVIDDFERASIPAIEILGYVNNLTENLGMKVILVGYEDEVEFNKVNDDYLSKYRLVLDYKLNKKWMKDNITSKNNKSYFPKEEDYNFENLTEQQLSLMVKDYFNKSNRYKIVKEKTILKTIDFENNICDAMLEITKNAKIDEELKSTIIKKFAFFNAVMERLETNNLRSYIFFLNITDRLYVLLKSRFSDNPMFNDLISVVLDSVFYISYDFKKTNEITTTLYQDEEGIGTIMLGVMNNIKSFDIINRYIVANLFDEDEFVNYFENYLGNMKVEKQNKIDKLSYYYIQKDEEVEELVKSIRKGIIDNDISYKVFPTILNIIGNLETMGFKSVYLDATYKNMRESIRKQFDNLEDLGLRDSFMNPTSEKATKLIENYYEYITTQVSQKTEKELVYKLEGENWAHNLSDQIYESKNLYYKYKRFFDFFDIEELVTKLEQSYSGDIREFRSGIRRIYDFDNLQDFYKKDLPSLKSFLKKLELAKSPDKISQTNLNWLIDDIKKYIKKLDR